MPQLQGTDPHRDSKPGNRVTQGFCSASVLPLRSNSSEASLHCHPSVTPRVYYNCLQVEIEKPKEVVLKEMNTNTSLEYYS